MKTVTLINRTEKPLIVEYQGECHRINKGFKFVMQYTPNTALRCYIADESSSRFCLTKYFSQERRIYPGISLYTNFASVFELTTATRRIEITEKRLSFSSFVLFGVLLFNGGYAKNYEYQQPSDKRRYQLLGGLSLLFTYGCGSALAVIAIVSLIGLIFDFCFELIFVALLSGVLSTVIFLALGKNIRKFFKFSENFLQIIEKSTPAVIYKDKGWYIEYTELE